MKKRIFLILLIFFFLFNIDIKASSNKYYNKFYDSLKYALLHKKNTIKLSGYDYTKFNINGNVKKIMLTYKNAKYIVTDVKTVKKSKNLTYVYIKYKDASYVANTRGELDNILLNVIKSGITSTSIKINGYTKNYNFESIIDSLDLSSSNFFLTGFSYKVYQHSLIPNQVIVDFTFRYNDLSRYRYPSSKYILKNRSDLYSAIKNELYNLNDRIYLQFTDIMIFEKPSIVFDYITKVLEDYGELYYIKSYGYVSFGSNVVVLINYTFPRNNIKYMRQHVEMKAKDILSRIINDNMSDYEKELAIHDYLVSNTKYDYTNVIKNTVPDESHTSYGALIRGVAVCDGYATAFNILLRMAGIENKIVYGFANGVPHSWNLVKLDGQWYHVDVTFDDPVVNGGEMDIISHRYFNVTDNQILIDHSFDRTRYPKSSTIPYTPLK